MSWSDWKRSDGTNTTWMPDLWDRPDLVKSWKQKQKKKRRELAEQSLDIQVRNDIDVHNANTLRRAQALSEKTEKRQRRPIRYNQWDVELERNLADRENDPEADSLSRNLRTSSIRTDGSHSKAPSVISASCPGLSGSRRRLSQTPSSSQSATAFPNRAKTLSSRGSQETLSTATPSAESRSIRPLPTRAKLRSPAKDPPSR